MFGSKSLLKTVYCVKTSDPKMNFIDTLYRQSDINIHPWVLLLPTYPHINKYINSLTCPSNSLNTQTTIRVAQYSSFTVG